MILIRKIKQNISNILGWQTNKKIVVFESDDWGSIRTRSNKDLEILRKFGTKVDKCNYMLNDSLASESDLNELFNILTSHKDKIGNHPVFTANCLVANPNFKKIKEFNFNEYHYESFIETLKNYASHSNSFNLWKKGIDLKIFHPQSHGREHLNISRWIKDLKNNVEETKLAFDMEMFGISGNVSTFKRGSYQAAFDGGEYELIFNREEVIIDALNNFNIIFGYQSESFISPNYVWDDTIEKVLSDNNVKFIQSSRAQIVSTDYEKKRKIKRHFIGQKNNFNQLYLVRNCFFEPSANPTLNWVDSCLKDIEIAFKWKKPAIISTHRVNFIGYINPKNRDKNLPLLNELITRMLKKWPDVVFITSDQLGNLIVDDGKK